MPFLVHSPHQTLLMASSRNCSLWLRFGIGILMLSLTFLPSHTVGLLLSSNGEAFKQNKMVLGSRPPLCINKCYKCKPCKATLVIPPHRLRKFGISFDKQDDTYYLLTWKCRCGDKTYHP